MSDILLPVLLSATLLAYANGANDNFKGVATLYGAGLLNYRAALWAATTATWLGSVAALVLAGRLVRAFSGKGLVTPEVLGQGAFPLAVALGAALTVLVATRLGLPISTTHALIGALVGAGLSAGSLHAEHLAGLFLLPLALSPLLAATLAGGGFLLLRRLRPALARVADACLCVAPGETADAALNRGPWQSVALSAGAPVLRWGTAASCRLRGASLPGVSGRGALDVGHMVSGLLVSFARGLNDTPKITGILLIGAAAGASLQQGAVVAVATVMALGGLLSARRVARVMSLEITGLDEARGLAANLVTSFLVLVASRFGVPVSTTHVSCGALFGIGAAGGEGHWRTIAVILGAWFVTLPAAALTAAIIYWIASP